MDKIKKYQDIICDLLHQYGAIKKIPNEVKAQILIDKENHHYHLLSMGWHKNGFTYQTTFHFDIIGQQIWIQQNNTDVMIADELMEKGVLKDDIVLGFSAPTMRQYSGFANP